MEQGARVKIVRGWGSKEQGPAPLTEPQHWLNHIQPWASLGKHWFDHIQPWASLGERLNLVCIWLKVERDWITKIPRIIFQNVKFWILFRPIIESCWLIMSAPWDTFCLGFSLIAMFFPTLGIPTRVKYFFLDHKWLPLPEYFSWPAIA